MAKNKMKYVTVISNTGTEMTRIRLFIFYLTEKRQWKREIKCVIKMTYPIAAPRADCAASRASGTRAMRGPWVSPLIVDSSKPTSNMPAANWSRPNGKETTPSASPQVTDVIWKGTRGLMGGIAKGDKGILKRTV
jgi:hypothetical protein